MRQLLRDAEQVLETAVAAGEVEPRSTAICVTNEGGIRIIDSPFGWTPQSLAAHHGADTVYLMEQRSGRVRVQAWSRGESCVLTRELPRPPKSEPRPLGNGALLPRFLCTAP